MKYIHIEHASIRLNVKNGYILVWVNDTSTYESVISWQVYRTKAIAIDIIKLIAIMAYLIELDYKVTVYNTEYQFYRERDNVYMLLYTADQTLLEQRDQDVLDLIEDGFINPRNVHASMVEYYNSTFA